jgi:hypothetical protein
MNSDDSSFDDRTYSLPPDLLQLATEVDAEITRSINYTANGYLVRREIHILSFEGMSGRVNLKSGDLVDFLNPVLHVSTHDAVGAAPPPRRLSFTSPAGRKILQFMETYFYELRDLICKTNKGKFPISSQTTVAVSGITHWLLEHFGIHEELAKSVATTILVGLLIATKGTFCKMTEKEAKAALAKV